MVRKLVAVVLGFAMLALSVTALDFDVFGIKGALQVRSGAAPTSVSNEVVPRVLTLVCPGSGYVEGSSRAGSATFSKVGSAQVGLNQSSAASYFAATEPTVVQASTNVSDQPQGSVLLSANQIQPFSAPAQGFGAGANGLIGADCVRPASDFWLVGASTAVGRQALLIVHNPSPVDATFDLELFDEGGPVAASGMQGLSVVAGKTLVLPLAAFAQSNPSLVVHLASQGGAVAAWVQQKTVRGTVASGIDFISPSSAPNAVQVLPGLTVVGAKAASEIAKANPDYADLTPLVRLFAPTGSAKATKSTSVTVVVSGIDAKTFGTVVRQDINVGQTTDVPLPGLADGRYSVEVTSDVPLFASMKVSVNSGDPAKVLKSTGSDFTWVSAAEPITSNRDVMVPAAGQSSLNIVNQKSTPATVKVQDLVGGKTETYLLQANSTIEVSPKAGSNLQIESNSQVYANLTTRLDNGVATFRILDAKNLGGKVSVSLR
jgi:hypothetical protein